MKTILVPVGSSKNAKCHLQYAVDFAKHVGAKLYVVQIFNVYTKAGTMIKIDHILERESLEFLKSHVNAIDAKGVDVVVKTFKGKLVDTIQLISNKLDIDLIILEPRTNSIKDEVYLGKTSGKIIKQTNIPALIVPEKYKFKPINSILMAIKSATKHKAEDFEVDEALSSLVSKTTETVNATTFQGVLEHYSTHNPDLLCVVRRKRGFFKKLWEKNNILRKDFYISNSPVLVLSGLK